VGVALAASHCVLPPFHAADVGAADDAGGLDAAHDGDGSRSTRGLGKAIRWTSSCASASSALSAPLAFDNGEPFTVELWFRPDRVGGYQMLLWKGGSASAYPGWQVVADADGLTLLADDGTKNGGARSGGLLRVGDLYHLAATREGDRGEMWVLDASVGEKTHSLVGTTSAMPTSWSTTQRLVLGGLSSDATSCEYGAGGVIDDVRVWAGRRAVSDLDAEFAGAVECSALGLLAYWKIDDAAGTLLHDCGPYQIHLSIHRGQEPVDYEWVDSPFGL